MGCDVIYSTINSIPANVLVPIPTAGDYSPISSEHVPILFFLETEECVDSVGGQVVLGDEAYGFLLVFSSLI